MQFKAIISVLSLAVAASAVPTSPPPAPTCNNNQTLACCNSIASGVGIGCILSTLNILNPVCSGGQSLACCSNAQQNGLVNVQCVPVNVVL